MGGGVGWGHLAPSGMAVVCLWLDSPLDGPRALVYDSSSHCPLPLPSVPGWSCLPVCPLTLLIFVSHLLLKLS